MARALARRGRWPAAHAAAARPPGLAIGPGERLEVTAVRDAFATTMVVLRDPGEVFVLRHTLGRRPLTDPDHGLGRAHRPADARAGRPLAGSGQRPVLAGRHGGARQRLAARRRPATTATASRRSSSSPRRVPLPGPRPYNSFVVLADGTLVMKDFDRDLREPAQLVLLDPDTLTRRCADVALGEPAIARLSADGDDLYVVGARTVHRLRWDGARLERDADVGRAVPARRPELRLGSGDRRRAAVVHGQRRARVRDDDARRRRRPGPVHLIRMSLADPRGHRASRGVRRRARGGHRPSALRRRPPDRDRLRLRQRRGAGVSLRRHASSRCGAESSRTPRTWSSPGDRRARDARLPRPRVRAHAHRPRDRDGVRRS